jgi:DUF1009 family protein
MEKIKANEIKKVGIIAGSGSLPRHVADACIKKGIDFILIGTADNTSHELYQDIKYETFQLYAVSKVIKKLHAEGVSHIVLAGKVRRATLSKLLLDFKGAKLLANIIKGGLNDNSILLTIVEFFENEGFKIISPEHVATDILVKSGPLTKKQPSEENWEDIKKGVKILKGIAEYDVGQALVIQGGLVLGVEAAEGTDELIKRCGNIRQQDDEEVILVKICKPKQDKRVDLPCIGPNTIQNLHLNGLAGVAIEAGAALILDEAATRDEADRLGVFIYGI